MEALYDISVDSRRNSTRQILLSKLREVKVIIQGQTVGKRWSKSLNLRDLTPKLMKCQKNYSKYLTYPSSFTPHSNPKKQTIFATFYKEGNWDIKVKKLIKDLISKKW